MRSIWSGSINFGLVNIPVKLYSAIEGSGLDLDMLDSKDHSRIRFKRVNENTDKEVPYESIVKGYMYNDMYVVLDDKDFEEAAPEKTKTIEILNFVQEKEIDSIYYEQSYFTEPAKGGERAYGILREALKESGKVGISTFVMRTKEALAVIKPYHNIILLNKIHFQEEIRSEEELNIPEAGKAKSKEVQMANKLIDQLTEKFNIAKYKDTYTEKLLKIIEAKANGKKITRKKLSVVHRKNDDVMEMLKASLGQRRAS
jgi:DNA end-binding protein Ku